MEGIILFNGVYSFIITVLYWYTNNKKYNILFKENQKICKIVIKIMVKIIALLVTLKLKENLNFYIIQPNKKRN